MIDKAHDVEANRWRGSGKPERYRKAQPKEEQRARKMMRQPENNKNKGMKLCSMGCGCPGVRCDVEAPPGITTKGSCQAWEESLEAQEEEALARGPDKESAKGPGANAERSKRGEEREVMGLEDDEDVFPTTIDSGAVDTVGPKKVGEGFPIHPTTESVMGI